MDINEEKDTTTDSKHLEITKINEFIYLGSCEHPISNSEEFETLLHF